MDRYLGQFEQLLLFALLDSEGEVDGASIRERIESRTGRLVSPGAVYTAMDRLEGRGFVSSRIRTAPPEEGGRERKYYWLEREGAQALEHCYRALSRMAEGLERRLAEAAASESGGSGGR